ncbi:MAG: hypothetical protein ACLGXA_24455 [Acidobacteriota bacterium]
MALELEEDVLTGDDADEEQETAAREYAPGELAPSIVTKSKVWKPADLEKQGMLNVILDLLRNCFSSDEAPRRWQVLETWEARLFDRGYQHLEGTKEGGWRVPAAGGRENHNGIADQDEAGVFATNILSSQGDIAIGALNRGAVKISFSPRRNKRPQDVAAAAAANEYRWLWTKNNATLQYDLTSLGWTDPRAVVWTRTIADKRFGHDDDGNPRQIELSSVFGVLESRLPMMANAVKDCGHLSVFDEMDYGIARATYPWMGRKLKPSLGTFGETEFERIARINTRVGVLGRYATSGVSGIREVSMGYHWIRPGLFYSDQLTDLEREFFLANFEDGLFCVTGGTELCAAWNESMDAHVESGTFTRGQGQSRRALGSSDLPIQKRVNLWADLWDNFVRSAIPITVLDSMVFNTEAVAELEATPRRFLPATPNEGQKLTDAVGQTPAPAPIPGMAEMFQWYVGPLIQGIDGATPALFGGGEGVDNTVGATMIRLNQALERYSTPWQMANNVMARAAWQAAKCCANNNDEEIFDSADGYGDVCINPEALRNGEYTSKAETLGSIPESGAQREAKVLEVLEMANTNAQVASIVATPSNAREIVKALHIDDVITVDEAESEDKQIEEIELLLNNEPLLNPAWQELSDQLAKLTATHEVAKALASQAVAGGTIPDEQTIAQGQAMEEAVAALQKQLNDTPQNLPYVPVAQDDSEDHETEAATLFTWMQTSDGRTIRRKADREQPGDMESSPNWCKWTNCYLHWQGHKAMAAKFSKASLPPKLNFTGKLTPEQQAQILQAAGIETDPASVAEPQEAEQETIQRGPFAEVKTRIRKRL